MAALNAVTASSLPPKMPSARWNSKLWENLAASSASSHYGLVKIIGLGILFLGLVVLVYIASRSKGNNRPPSPLSQNSPTIQLLTKAEDSLPDGITQEAFEKVLASIEKFKKSCINWGPDIFQQGLYKSTELEIRGFLDSEPTNCCIWQLYGGEDPASQIIQWGGKQLHKNRIALFEFLKKRDIIKEYQRFRGNVFQIKIYIPELKR
jgi:hypothetical protein